MRLYALLFPLVFLTGFSRGQGGDPVFFSRQDSLAYIEVNSLIEHYHRHIKVICTDPDTVKILDSLGRQRAYLRERIAGYRLRYLRPPGITEWDDIWSRRVSTDTVTRLIIRGQNITRLPKNIIHCTQLARLELWDTRIKRLPPFLNKLNRLTEIRIYNHRAPLRLRANKHVEQVTIRGTWQHDMPRSFRKFKNLVRLDLSDNLNLTAFPNIYANRHLKELYLNKNRLTLHDLKLNSKHPALEKLFIQQNRIESLPDGITGFTRLTHLNLAENSIRTVTPRLSELIHLRELSFYRNRLTEIPHALYGLRNLEVVDLYYNQIEEVSEAIGSLSRLSILYLSNNRISRLPESIGNLSYLKELYIHHNRLSYLPASVANLQQLRTVRINDNYFTTFPEPLLQLPQLEYLDIANNEIRNLPPDLQKFQYMKILVLKNNRWENPSEVDEITAQFARRGVIVHH